MKFERFVEVNGPESNHQLPQYKSPLVSKYSFFLSPLKKFFLSLSLQIFPEKNHAN